MATFRKADADLSGVIEKGRLRTMLKRLDFGVGDVEDRVSWLWRCLICMDRVLPPYFQVHGP
jgi:hypothetical protein